MTPERLAEIRARVETSGPYEEYGDDDIPDLLAEVDRQGRIRQPPGLDN